MPTFLGGCTGEPLALQAGKAALRREPLAEVIGAGRYTYRFTLVDPHTGTASPHQAYALTIRDSFHQRLPFVSDEKNVYQGTTDELGRTAVFRLAVRLPDRAWDLRQRFGSGPNGTTFRLEAKGSHERLGNMPYLLIVCAEPPRYYQGYSYPDGSTGYVATEIPERIEVDLGLPDADERPTRCAPG